MGKREGDSGEREDGFGAGGVRETGNCAILPNVISEVILCCVFSVIGCLCTL